MQSQSIFAPKINLTLSNSKGDNEKFSFTTNNSNIEGQAAGNDSSGGQFLKSLTYVRNTMGAAGNELTFILVDNTQMDLEFKIRNNWQYVSLQYTGYTKSENGSLIEKVHGPYQLYITSIKTRYTPYGSVINCTAMSVGYVKNQTSLPLTKDQPEFQETTLAGPPHLAVKKLLERINVKTQVDGISTIEDTDSVLWPDKYSGDGSAKSERTYSYRGEPVLDYIRDEILPFAKSKNSTSSRDFVLYFDDKLSTSNEPVAVFRSNNTVIEGISQKHEIQFEINKKHSNVVAWEPDYSGAPLIGKASVSVSYPDPATGEIKWVNAVGSPSEPASSYKLNSSLTPEEAQAVANWYYERRLYSAHTATIELVNYTDVQCGDYIDVLAVTNKTNVHHSSGQYLVRKATDSIESGLIKTTCDLVFYKPLRMAEFEKGSPDPFVSAGGFAEINSDGTVIV